jgi:hypothetical protein
VPRSVPNAAKLAWVPSRAPLPVRLLKLYEGIDQRVGPSSDAIAACPNAAFIYVFGICVYVFGISAVAAMLFAAVNAIEPDRRYASVLKLLIVSVSAAAIAGRLMRSSADGLSALMP